MRQALELALEALERSVATCFDQRSHDAVMGRPEHFVNQAITAIKEALAQPERPADCERCNRLEDALKRANGLAEHFERAWYLRGDEIERLTAQPEQEPVTKYCCHLCFNKSGQLFLDRMIVCPECGNKRCPKATHHKLLCTNSNESNQTGSIYTTPPQRTWVGLTDEEMAEIIDAEIGFNSCWGPEEAFARAIEAKLKEKNT